MMKLNRRKVLMGGLAMAGMPRFAKAKDDGFLELAAFETQMQLVEGEYPKTAVWGFNGSVPGPLLGGVQGERMRVRLRNELTENTAVHWHGMRVKNAMDGVPGMTMQAVPPQGSFDYEISLRDAGTYWYHSHNRSLKQVSKGLYGIVVARESSPLDVDHDLVVVLDDWRLSPDAQITDDFGNMHDLSHAGRLGNYIHAVVDPLPTHFAANQRVRLRFVNTATDRIMPLALQGVEGWIVARDGMPLARPEAMDQITLGPAERVDAIVDVTAEAGGEVLLAFREGDQGYVLAETPVLAGARARRAPVEALPPNPITNITSVADARAVPMVMEGGAMGGLRGATFKGENMDMRALVQEGQVWAVNGVAGLPDAPLFEASLEETVVLNMQNDTAFPHAMHMHGTHFQEVLPDGSFGPHKDTVLMMRGEQRAFAFVADNPGKWLIHCHMLSHQTAGMKTWFKVS
ncbi:multicopper oxidase family protein [Shimia haliotis]|uniref:Multicopper oxidase with three cupredoxin domains (Includes cell division protein FtsP and spore coat protein CotA) n=1 Tax=Shimia haliotis TaxID=1280847 RepID=A0A1I4EBD9_9RHOB|nr:multicopper oxidase family protein [Shimia haliotis]SFL01927.1 Multicopper oxidase with three cupredoxin domains (includes cell division protein FtsP and spore coat protein CotA) [Shimia haliotis]